MPTYVYRRADGTTFEHFQRITDDALTEDPETGQPVTRVISGGAGLQFKGTGFYETDYVRKSGVPEKTSEAASDSKPAATDSASASGSASTETTSTTSSSSSDD
ncbi:MAG: hypothetical protein Rubg2KO_18880 [Rubricoccaceae bacterium]